VRNLFLRSLFTWLRERARGLGFDGTPGAVTFEQRFSSTLRLHPHLHVVVPEGLFVPGDDGEAARLLPLPPPDDEEVEALLKAVVARTLRLLRKRGLLDDDAVSATAHEDTLAASLSHPLPFHVHPHPRNKRRCALVEGFSLHANTAVHEHDRQGLFTLCRYGARGALSLSRLQRLPDGRLSYRLKRPSSDGATHLVLTALELTRKLAALVPPPRAHLIHFHGVFAPRARLRPHVVPRPPPSQPERTPLPQGSPAPGLQLPSRKRKRRLDWAELLKRVFAVDVLSCPCGGKRRVLAFLTQARVVRAILHHLHLPAASLPLASAQAPPQLRFEV
jgi:hypothetical protein